MVGVMLDEKGRVKYLRVKFDGLNNFRAELIIRSLNYALFDAVDILVIWICEKTLVDVSGFIVAVVDLCRRLRQSRTISNMVKEPFQAF